ncbi:MAG: hypothetical protein ACRD5Z_19550, partial [Bryobacteraceae bacterium]
PISNATWYIAGAEGDGLVYRVKPGSLASVKYIAADMLLDGDLLAVFDLLLQEQAGGPTFRFTFGALTQCSFRMRLPLELLNQNRWMIDREGAFLKPMASGDRVDPKKVDRITLQILRKGPNPVRWCMTAPTISTSEIPKLSKPLLPKGALLDQFGQSVQRNWPAKTRSTAELKGQIQKQSEAVSGMKWPEEFSAWGGWQKKKLGEGSGFFRTHTDGRRAWLVDPDGYAFWSTGLDCVRVDTNARFDGIEGALSWRPDPKGEFAEIYDAGAGGEAEGKLVNFLAANMIRAFGRDGWKDKWSRIALSKMRRLRFNTVGNWSDWKFASAARFPYVRPLEFRGKRSGTIYRDFPDVFHPGFEADAADYAAPLR